MDKPTKLFILSIVFIAIFGIIDSKQIVMFQLNQDWDNYLIHIAPNFIFSWMLVLIAIALTYYILVKDKSESLGIFAAGYSMLLFGVEDFFFFLLSPNVMSSQMCWFTFPINFVSKLFGETCVSSSSLVLNAALGVYIAWMIINWFWRQRGW